MQQIFAATELAGFEGSAKVLDLMSGPGKVGLGLQKRASQHTFFYLDLSRVQLGNISSPSEEGFQDHKIRADAMHLPIHPDSFDRVVARYAVKDIPDAGQLYLLHEVWKTVRPGGIFVLVDMTAPLVKGAKDWLNSHHALKQKFSGRDEEKEGTCLIHTEGEWVRMMRQAGFETKISDRYISHVTTTDWVKGQQITSEQLEIMNENIRSAPEQIRKVFNVSEEKGLVRLDYSVAIIQGRKS